MNQTTQPYGFANSSPSRPYPPGQPQPPPPPPPPYEQPWQNAPPNAPPSLYPRLDDQWEQRPEAGHAKPAGYDRAGYNEGAYRQMAAPEGPPLPADASPYGRDHSASPQQVAAGTDLVAESSHHHPVANAPSAGVARDPLQRAELSVPYASPIPGALRPGMMVRVRGTPLRGSGFAVNLQTGIRGGGNVALHVNLRFTLRDQGAVVRNSKINGTWGTEERNGPPSVLRQGQPFEILILAEGSNYKIAINGQHYVDFIHRVPLDVTDTVSITGDVQLISVDVC